MARKLRLDAVVTLREREEEQAREALGAAVRATAAAEATLAEAQQRARRDGRGAAPVEAWAMEEAAHERALQDVKNAALRLETARTTEHKARESQVEAYRRAEVVRRVAAARRRELDEADARAENKAMDEFASIKHEARRKDAEEEVE